MDTRNNGNGSLGQRLGLTLHKRQFGEVEVEFYPLGEYIVIQPNVCDGRPTVLNTSIGGRDILGALKNGASPKQVAKELHIPLKAVKEAVALAEICDYGKSYTRQPYRTDTQRGFKVGTRKKRQSSLAQRLGLPLQKRMFGEAEIEFYPLGKYIVIQPGVCGGRPTVLNRRITAQGIMELLTAGYGKSRVAKNFQIPLAAVKEAEALAKQYDYEVSYA